MIDAAVAFSPAVELAGRDVEPPDEPPGADLGLLVNHILKQLFDLEASVMIYASSCTISARTPAAHLTLQDLPEISLDPELQMLFHQM